MSDLKKTLCLLFPSSFRASGLIAAFALLICLLAAESAQAQLTLTVTRADDRNATCVSGVDCSLREAVNAANAAPTNDTINFDGGLTTITLTNEIAVMNGTLTINGTGANVLTIDGGAGYNRIFYTQGADVTIQGVTLTGGDSWSGFRSGYGGAIYANFSSLVLDGVHVTANSAMVSGGIHFGEGNHQILNSTFSDNTADNCGAFFNQGFSTLAVTNSTITGNGARGYGGGFCNTGETILRSVTVTENYALDGGGIYQGDISFSGEVYGTFNLNLGNTIVAGNIGFIGPEIYSGRGTLTSAGYNVIGDNRGVEAAFPGGNPNAKYDIVGANPLLGPLADNGGATQTRALLFGSPAIDKGNAFGLTTDQRGLARPVDFDNTTYPNATGGDGSDIGAYEAQTAPTAPTVLSIDDGDSDDLITTGETLSYTVTFSKDINASTVSSSDFDNAGTSSITIGAITETTATSGIFNVQVMPTTAGTIILRIPSGADIRDTSYNRLATPVQDDTTVTANDITAPTVFSITRASANPTFPNTSVQFTVTFSEIVTGVDSTDFTLIAANLSGASITSVTGSGKTYTVTVNTGTITANQTSGTLRVDAVDNDSIKDASNNPLGGAGAGSGNYSSGESYTVNDFTSFVVTKTADTNDGVCDADCSLREAMTAANADPGKETITFDIAGAGSHTIQLTSALPALSQDVDILNTSGESITVKGVGIPDGFRVFRLINFGVTVSISNLTISNGFSDDYYGGAIRNNGTLTLTNCIISSNTSTQYGGGIFNSGALTLINSTISDNYAKFYGGGIYTTGGVLTMTNSTISNNFVGDSGGGIYISSGTATFINTTISTNSASSGGGIYNDFGTLTLTNITLSNNSAEFGGIYNNNEGTVTLRSSIIAKNTGRFGGADLRGTFTSSGYNLIGDNSGATITAATADQIGTQSAPIDPLLGSLADNGGPTETHVLLYNSSAIDKGKNFGSITDQRGFARPVDNPGISNVSGGDGADIGAFEVQAAPTAATVSVSGRVVTESGRGIVNVRLTLTETNGQIRTAATTAFGYYRFDNVRAGETIVLSAKARRFKFVQSSIVRTTNESISDADFVGQRQQPSKQTKTLKMKKP